MNKVVIVGLLPNQEQHIRREFGKHFKLRFVHQKSSKGSCNDLYACLASADVVVLMTKFVSHRDFDHITNPVFVNGGMTDLRNNLRKISNAA